jgi:hypothetical protein
MDDASADTLPAHPGPPPVPRWPKAVAALDLVLTDGEIAELQAPYQPQDNYWW